jgi:hypothetical protein
MDTKKRSAGGALKAFYKNAELSGVVDALGELCLQVACLVLVDYTTLGELVDHCDHRRSFFAGSSLVELFQVANGITGGLAIITVALATLSGLTHIFLCCLMISHVLLISEGKGKEKVQM